MDDFVSDGLAVLYIWLTTHRKWLIIKFLTFECNVDLRVCKGMVAIVAEANVERLLWKREGNYVEQWYLEE